MNQIETNKVLRTAQLPLFYPMLTQHKSIGWQRENSKGQLLLLVLQPAAQCLSVDPLLCQLKDDTTRFFVVTSEDSSKPPTWFPFGLAKEKKNNHEERSRRTKNANKGTKDD